jgi:hypothetical protein
MGEIYCLYSTSDGRPRYIGQTEWSGEKRFKKHVTLALEGADGELYDWMRRAWRSGGDIHFHVLQSDIIPADLLFYERYWMTHFPKLLNIKDNSEVCEKLTDVGRQIVTAIKAKLVMTAEDTEA